MNVAIYARVSTEWQAEHGYSISTQLEACREKAKAIGATVVKEYIDDGYSGGFLERPALESLRDAVQDGLYEAVILHDADRLARKLIHQLILTEEFEKAHCHPIFVMGEIQNTPEGQMSYQMKGVFAEYERAKIRERTMRGKRAKLRAGKAICDSHIYGYDFDRENCCYTINPAEAKVVKLIYKWYVEDMIGGCEVIAKMLNDRGIPSPSGNISWHPSSVRNLLHRPHYTGKYYANTRYNKKTGPKTYKRIPRPRDEWIEMTCPQIIDEELHQRALSIKSTHRTYKTWKHDDNPGLLQGLAYCGSCGAKIRIGGGGKRFKKWYMCHNTAPRNGKKCSARYMEILVADEIFWQVLENVCRDEKTLSAYINAKKSPNDLERPQQKKYKVIVKRIEKIQTERKVIMKWFSTSLLSQDEATEKLTALKQEESQLKEELASMAAVAPANAPKKLSPSDICTMIKNCPATAQARRKAIMTTIERVNILRTDQNYGHKYIIDFDIFFK